MVGFVSGDRVKHRKPKYSFQNPSFTGGATVISINGQAVFVKLDVGGNATYPYDILELETPDPSREEKPKMVRRIPIRR